MIDKDNRVIDSEFNNPIWFSNQKNDSTESGQCHNCTYSIRLSSRTPAESQR